MNSSESIANDRLSKSYETLRGISRAAVSARSREVYLAEVTRVLVEGGAFTMSSIAWHEPETGQLVIVAQSGDRTGYTDRIRVFVDEREEGQGPGGRALRSGVPVICNDFLNDPTTLPWREEALLAGWKASAAIPIQVSEESRGVLGVYATQAGFFGPKEVELLQQVANDVAFVLRSFELEEQRREAASALTANQRRLKLATDAAKVGTFDWDLTTGSVIWDQHLERLFGIEPGGFGGTYGSFEERLHPEDVPELNSAVKLARESRSAISLEFRVLWPDGSAHWVLSRGEFFYDDSGRPIRMCGAVMDIDAHKRTEHALIEAEARFRHAFDSLIEGCMLIDFDWKYLYVNGPAARHGLREREELMGRSMLDVYPGVENSEVFKGFRRCMEERVSLRFEEKITFPSGPVRWYEFSVTPVREGIFVMSLDITDRKRDEEQKVILASLVEASHDFIGVANLEGDVTYLNSAAKSMVGLEDSDVAPGLTLYDFFAEEERKKFVTTTEPRVRAHGWVRDETSLRHFRTGQLIPVDLQTVTIRDAYGAPICLATVTRDLTERVAAERQKAKLEAKLAQAQKMEALGRLTGGIAHDFNNSLTVVLGYAALLASSEHLNGKERGWLKAIADAGACSRDLVTQLMGFSRQQVVSPKPLDLNHALTDSHDMLTRLIGEDIELQIVPERDLWNVLLDPTQLNQVLMNLAANARDAMIDGGKLTLETRNVRIDTGCAGRNPGAHPGDYVLLEVSDTGMGMDAETATQVFEPFFTTKEKGKGTGLGLATVYGIVRQNGGFIDVYSEVQQGTTFKIYLPRLTDIQASGPEKGATTGYASGTARAILLVEDDELVRDMMAEALHFLGYEAITAESAGRAIELCRDTATPIDLVISDVVMPEMKGSELRDQLVKLRPELKVLFVSGYTSNVIARKGILKPGVHFLQKPFSFEGLKAKVEEALRG